jgi:GDSL-like Lipase/Acylhydrolase
MRFRAPVVSFARGALLAAAVSAFNGTADAQNFGQYVGFGDSTVDSGWYYTHLHDTNPALETLYKASQAIGGGISTTPGGPMNSQVLASLFGLTAIPVGEPGGTNYAAGGAANINYSNYTTPAPNTVSQIQSYLAAAGGVANSSALYMISSGGNDIHGAICPGGVCAANAAQLATNSADALVAAIAQLHAAGAQYFVVTINYGAVPGAATGTPAAHSTTGSCMAASPAPESISFRYPARSLPTRSTSIRDCSESPIRSPGRQSPIRAVPASIQIPPSLPRRGLPIARRLSRRTPSRAISSPTTCITPPPVN